MAEPIEGQTRKENIKTQKKPYFMENNNRFYCIRGLLHDCQPQEQGHRHIEKYRCL